MNSYKASMIVELALVCAAALATTALHAAPPVIWDPQHVSSQLAPAETENISVSFTAMEDLGSITLSVNPALSSLVSITPTSIPDVKKGTAITISLLVTTLQSTSTGIHDGVIQIRLRPKGSGKNGVMSRPLPVVINVQRIEDLDSPDIDQNGVWDYVDDYIETQFSGADKGTTRSALRQFSRALQGGILNASDKEIALNFFSDSDRAQECMFSIDPEGANLVLTDLEAVVLRNRAKSLAFLVFNQQAEGEVFPTEAYSRLGNSCVLD